MTISVGATFQNPGMARHRKRKTNRQGWDPKNMAKAMQDVLKNRVSKNSAAKIYSVPEPTLRRYLKKFNGSGDDLTQIEKSFPENAGRFKKTFNFEQKEELKQYVINIDKRAFGLTKAQFGTLCYNFAEKSGVIHRFNQEKKVAGRDFIESFMKDCGLVLRKPEATSAARLMAFNKVNVENFFKVLRELRSKYSFQPSNIYNVDETGFSTVPTKTPKVLTPQGNRRVIKLSSAERGTTVTCVCAMNAVGNFVPPFFIFPRVRMKPSFLDGAPPGSQGIAHESGWMTAHNFIKYLQHFVSFTKPSKDNPILLLMDNHASHLTIDAVEFCRENFIFMLGFPAHTSHKLQPLDVAFYGPLKTAYSVSCDDYLTNNPGSTISIKDICAIFNKAYLKAATVKTAVNGFKVTGIEPFDSAVFSDEDFEPSATTDIPVATGDDVIELQEASTSSLPDKSFTEPVSNTTNTVLQPVSNLPPLPKAVAQKSRKPRRKLPSLHITGSPVKTAMETIRKEQEEKENRKKERILKRNKSSEKAKLTKKNKRNKKRAVRRLEFSSSDEINSVEVQYLDTNDDMILSDLQHDGKDCIICGEKGKDELWYQCYQCKLWAHSDCSGWDKKQAKVPYKCDFCL